MSFTALLLGYFPDRCTYRDTCQPLRFQVGTKGYSHTRVAFEWFQVSVEIWTLLGKVAMFDSHLLLYDIYRTYLWWHMPGLSNSWVVCLDLEEGHHWQSYWPIAPMLGLRGNHRVGECMRDGRYQWRSTPHCSCLSLRSKGTSLGSTSAHIVPQWEATHFRIGE